MLRQTEGLREASGAYLSLTGRNGPLLGRSKEVAVPGALTFESRTRVIAEGGRVTAAARKLAEMRQAGSMGWANAWRISIWARLLDADKAYEFVHLMLSKWTEDNLFDKPLVQLDGNWGATAGIAEMLLQSHRRADNGPLAPSVPPTFELHLLPALPANKWSTGSITGLRARGGFEVDLRWSGGALAEAVVRSHAGAPCVIRYGEKTLSLRLARGEVRRLMPADLR